MMSMNAKIIGANIEFDSDISGTNGRLFYITLHFKAEDGSGVVGRFNFLKLPQILQKLEIESFNDIIGTYVKIPQEIKGGDRFLGFTNIFDTKMTDIIEVDDRYFGDNFYDYFMKGYEMESD